MADQGKCKKRSHRLSPVLAQMAVLRTQRRKDAHVRRSSHGVFLPVADMQAGRNRQRKNKKGV